MHNPRELRQRRASIIEAARAHVAGDAPTAEQLAAFDRAMAEADTLMAQIERLERADTLAAELNAAINTPDRGLSAPSGPAERGTARENRIALAAVTGHLGELRAEDAAYREQTAARDYRILAGMGMAAASGASLADVLAPEDHQHFTARFKGPAGGFRAAGSAGTNGAGGYTVAPLFMREVIIAMKAFGGMRQVARNIQTDTGATLPWPTMDDTSNVATIVAENASQSPGTDLAFGQKTIGAYTYTSQPLLISLQLLQDSAFDFEQLIRDAMAIRFARGQNAHFTTGTGTGQPNGVVTAAASGVVGATGQTTSIIFDNLIALEHSVDPAYRAGARFMMKDSTLQAIKTLKDSYGRYLWLPGTTTGQPDTILGYPYTINQDVAAMTANAKSVLFGNFNNYIIRDVLDMQVMVLRERYADYLQVGYLGFMRSDGNLVSAASPIKYYANSAT